MEKLTETVDLLKLMVFMLHNQVADLNGNPLTIENKRELGAILDLPMTEDGGIMVENINLAKISKNLMGQC